MPELGKNTNSTGHLTSTAVSFSTESHTMAASYTSTFLPSFLSYVIVLNMHVYYLAIQELIILLIVVVLLSAAEDQLHKVLASLQPQAIDEKLVFGYPVLSLLVKCPGTASGWGTPQTMATHHASAPTTALFIVLLYI